MNKFIRLANYFDQQGFYKSADAIESFVKTSQSTFVEKQPDLAKIEKERPADMIPNDIAYYVSSITQGTSEPVYNPVNFLMAAEKLESMLRNPDVKNNFPKVFENIPKAIKTLQDLSTKSSASTPGSSTPVSSTPGSSTPGSSTSGNIASSSPSTPSGSRASRPDPSTPEGKDFDKKMKIFAEEYKKVRTFLTIIKNHQRNLASLEDDEKDEAPRIRQKINNYLNLISAAMLIIDDPEYGAVRKYLRQVGRFDPDQLPEDRNVPAYEDDEVLSDGISADASSEASLGAPAQPPVMSSRIIKKKILGLD